MAEERDDTEVTLVSQLDTRKPAYKIAGKTSQIETGIDKLHRLVREKGKIRLSEAASSLGVSEEIILEWGEILEEHKLIELHYPIAGKPILGVLRRKLPKPEKGKKEKKKEKKPAIPAKKRFTKKVILIYIEIIALGELLIYIFLVNRYLSMNFVPTLRFHLDGFVSYIMNLPGALASGNLPALLYQPMYLAFLVILLAVIVLIIALIARRKPKMYVKKPEKKSENKPEKEERKEEPEKEEKKEEKKEPEKDEKEEKERKDAVFAEIIERYKERMKELER
jgi:hypothetical protein